MINGFENITSELSEYEKEVLLPLFIKGLSKKVGIQNAVTNKHMVKALKEKGFNVSEARVRKIINYIRNQNLVAGLIANSNGYFISNDPVEIARYIDSLKQRANEIIRVKDSMVRHLRTVQAS